MRTLGSIEEAPAGVVFRGEAADRHQGLARSGLARRKYVHTTATDVAIADGYRQSVEGNDRSALTCVARRLGWPRHIVTKRGAELGLARVKEKDWSIEEIAVLEANCMYGYTAIQRKLAAAGFTRSRAAILLKRRRMGLVRGYDGYSANQLAGLVGLDGHVVTRWIEGGWLAAERRGTARPLDTYYITREAVREFLFARPEEFDLRKVEKWWFLELLTDGAICR